MNILVIGGAGYIGSHTIIELVRAGYTPAILDNFGTSNRLVPELLNRITKQHIPCVEGDFADTPLLQRTLQKLEIGAIVHFAAHKAVGESVETPLKYYKNNVAGFVTLLEAATRNDVPVVFSSSAAVYGNPATETVAEETICLPASPYGWSKLMDEVILRDACAAKQPIRGVALRYFNVVGAHDSGMLGEMPALPPQNLLPIIVEAVAGLRDPLTIYGDDYDTPDGTCLRDYVHVVDLAKAHVVALDHLLKQPRGYYDVFNVGTGKPTSVKELIAAFERVNKVSVPFVMGTRRAGDPQATSARVDKIKALGWQAEKNIEDACRDAWNWQLKRPDLQGANRHSPSRKK